MKVDVRGGVTTADAAEVEVDPKFGKVSFHDVEPTYKNLMASLYPDGLAGRSVIDCACNCGGYSLWSRELGASRCFGFDVRDHWIRQAEFLAREREHPSDGCSFEVLDLYDLPKRDEEFDIAIFKGIFYHLPDPVTGLRVVADKTRELLVLNTATRSGKDGFLAVARESTDFVMSGVYGLNWLPTGPEVLERILGWMGFPATRISFWHKKTPFGSGGQPLGRIEILAARDEATFRHYDERFPAARRSTARKHGVRSATRSRLRSWKRGLRRG
jgi:2-polyprenyl-3-methyl-5-hydroxy-6-metoxy-1,4-benzoquinol methylase